MVAMTQIVSGQVKIGDNPDDIDAASILELESSLKVMVISRISTEQMQQIQPLPGALVYNTDEACIFYFDGSTWNSLCDGMSGEPDNPDEPGDPDEPDEPGDPNEPDETDGSEGSLTGTPGSVFFADNPNGNPTETNEQFYWDNENNRLGIGTSTPINRLEVAGIMRVQRINNSAGTAAFPGYHFTNNSNTGMFAPQIGQVGFTVAGSEVMRLTQNSRVGILVTDPQATLHVGGDLRVDGNIIDGNGNAIGGIGNKTDKNTTPISAIRRVSTPTARLTDADYTLVLEENVDRLMLPKAGTSNIGRICIIKDLGGAITELSTSYRDLENNIIDVSKNKGTIWLQSDGVEWQQIN